MKICLLTHTNMHAWFIAEGLIHMGVVTVTADNGSGRQDSQWIEVHHSLYADFAMTMARKLDLEDTFEKTHESWHKAFVMVYFEKRIQNSDTSHDSSDDNSWEYAVE
jgi:long-subunit acyl-CoA synthetase (AMP-forming)